MVYWLINLLYIIIIIPFTRTVIRLRGGSHEEAIFMRYAQLDVSGISHVFIYE